MKRNVIMLTLLYMVILLFLVACSNTEQKKATSMQQEIRNLTHHQKYSAEVWDDLGIRDRWLLLLEYERDVEAIMGLDPINVVPFLDESTTVVGFYSHTERFLYLSKILLIDRDLALAVVRHELRHYYQNVLCDNLPKNNTDIATKTIELWDEYRKTESLIHSSSEYYSLPLEEDAYYWEIITN